MTRTRRRLRCWPPSPHLLLCVVLLFLLFVGPTVIAIILGVAMCLVLVLAGIGWYARNRA